MDQVTPHDKDMLIAGLKADLARHSAESDDESPGTPLGRLKALGDYAVAKGLCSGTEAKAPELFIIEALERHSAPLPADVAGLGYDPMAPLQPREKVLLAKLEAANDRIASQAREIDRLTEDFGRKAVGNRALNEQWQAEFRRAESAESNLSHTEQSLALMRADRDMWKGRTEAAEARVRELDTEVRQLLNQWENSCDMLNTVEAERDAIRAATIEECKIAIERRKSESASRSWNSAIDDALDAIDGAVTKEPAS